MMHWEDGAYEEHKRLFKAEIEKVFAANKINGVTVHDVYCDAAGEMLYFAVLSTPTMEMHTLYPLHPFVSDFGYVGLAQGIFNSYVRNQYEA